MKCLNLFKHEIIESNIEILPEDYFGLYSKPKLEGKFKILYMLTKKKLKQKFVLENSSKIKCLLSRYSCQCPKSIKNPHKYSGLQIYFSKIERKLIHFFQLLNNIVSTPVIYHCIRLNKLELLISELIVFDYRY